MRILFVHTDIHRYNPEDYGFDGSIPWNDMQFGISYISAFLKNNEHKTKLLFLNRHSWENAVSECIEEYKPDLLCFGGVSTQFKYVLKIAKFMKKKKPTIYQVFGGIHATLADLDILELPFDAICKGEGEIAMMELLDKLEKGLSLTRIMNLIIKENQKTFSNSNKTFLKDLDSLPFPDREMWVKYINRNLFGKHVVLISRGCPFNCTYCSNKTLRGIAEGSYVRFRSAENIIEELKYLELKYPPVGEIYFETEMITVDLSWLEKFCDALSKFNATRGSKIVFGVNIRINPGQDYDFIFHLLKKAGFQYVKVGIESGSETIRKKILKRNYSNEDIISLFNKAKAYNIKPHAYNMIGLPEETLEHFKETIKVNRACQPEDTHLAIFFPYPGTDLLKICKKKGYLRKDMYNLEEREDGALSCETFPVRIIEKYYARFDFDVYRGRRNTLSLFKKYIYRRYIVRKKLFLRIYVMLKKLIGKDPKRA